jgi:Trk-type K+ transport system membrane component
MLQWFGGMGIIVLAVAILPILGVGGMQRELNTMLIFYAPVNPLSSC